MGKQFLYEEEARDPLFEGAKKVYKAVKTTMGPKGRNVVIKQGVRPPVVTHDGVTVAKSIDATTEEKGRGVNVGIEMLQSVSSKMNDKAGDGTTTVTVLTYHIIDEARKLIAAGHNPMDFKEGIMDSATQVAKALKERTEDISGNKKRLAEIATISAGEKEVGELVAKVIHKVGENSVVTVEQGKGLDLTSEIVKGFTFERGYISPYFMTDTAKQEAVYSKPLIFITDRKLNTVDQVVPIVELAASRGPRSLLIICSELEGEALNSLVYNKLKGTLNAVAVKTPFGDDSKEILEDLAILTGGRVIKKEAGDDTDALTYEDFGNANKVIVTKDKTTIIDGSGTRSAINSRLSDLKEREASDRVAALEGRVAVIKVGGATETEIEEKGYRVEDAVMAAKASLAEGILPGAGTTLLQLSTEIKGNTVGHEVMRKALSKPYMILMSNSGLNPGAWEAMILAKEGYGVNVKDPKGLVNLKKAGIIDPTKVTREAVQNAASLASTFITVGGMVAEEPEKQDD